MSTSKSIEEAIQKGDAPIGVMETGEVMSLSIEERKGITNLFGRPGYGKSVALEIILLSDIFAGRGGIFIDPYGDLVVELENKLSPKDSIIVFEATGKNLDENIQKFEKDVDLDKLQKESEKFLLCKLDYRMIGQDGARDLGIYILIKYLESLRNEKRSIIIDEAHNFLNDEVFQKIIDAKENYYIFMDQTGINYRTDILESILKNTGNLVCFNLDRPTAKIINKFNPELDTNALIALEKYEIYAKLSVQDKPFIAKAKGVFPIPYSATK
ncbi:MAG TPA: hypothetical protein DIT25_00445 [Candidatus Moranbacteria bacterium]|nr:hypothetical protein [Candidatus Moranbacteria bacterium]